MKTKLYTLLCASVLALFLVISGVSASLVVVGDSTIEVTENSNVATFTVNNTGSETISVTLAESESDFDYTISGVANTFELASNETANIIITADDLSNLDFGENNVKIIATANDTTEVALIAKAERSFYDGENDGDLKVDIDNDFTVDGFGDDDEWYLFDEIKVEVNIENDGSYDIEDIRIEACLFDVEEDKCVLDEDDMEISEDKFDLDEKDDLDITITFILDADDYTEDTDNLRLYIKAIGELAGNDAEDDNIDGHDTGSEDSESANLIIPRDFVVITGVDISETASCGDEVTLTADVWNTGDKDQDEVFIKVYNSLLGLNEIIEMDDIDAFDNDELSLTISIPEGTEEKRYDIKITVYDDEDMGSDDIYEEDGEESEYIIYLTIEGCKVKNAVEVSAIAKSGGVAGGETVVEVTIVNTGSESSIFSLRSIGYESWASEALLDKSSFLLESGASEIVLVTLDVNKDASGDNGFNIEVSANGETIETKSILVPVEEYKGFSLSGSLGNVDWKLVGIVILNIILILAIIFIIVKIVRKK